MMQWRFWMVLLVLASLLVLGSTVWAMEGSKAEVDPTVREGTYSMTEVYVTIGLASAAAFTISISVLGAGFAVGKIGAAALGAAAEHPELLARSLLFVALAEGLAVLGFAVGMLIVMRIPA